MTLSTILNFVTSVFGVYAGNGVFSYLIIPVFSLAVVIILIRVVKFICMISF